MCVTCGCSDDSKTTITDLTTGRAVDLTFDAEHEHHDHQHDHDHHHHSHDDVPHTHASDGRVIRLEQDILAKNNRLAERNRGWFAGRNVLALNLVSSPGAGKTTLLERTIRDLGDEIPIHVIEGDNGASGIPGR